MVSQNLRWAWFSVAMSDPTNPPPGNPYGGPPPPSNPYGQAPPPPQQPAQPPAYGQPPQPYGAMPAYGSTNPDKRPGTVTAASIITIITSALGLLTFVLVAVLIQASDDVFDEVNREFEGQPGFEDYSTDDILNVITVILVIFAVWSLIAMVMAVLAMRRHNWARVVTVVSAVVSALVSLLAIPTVVSALPLIAAIAAVVLYFTGGANDWYRNKNPQPQLPVGTTQPWG